MQPINQPEGIVTLASPFSVAETIARIETAITGHGLTLFAHIDHTGAAASVGLKMQPAHVLIFGSPRSGTPLMIASPLLALDLPLKALVWQNDAGQAHGELYESHVPRAALYDPQRTREEYCWRRTAAHGRAQSLDV